MSLEIIGLIVTMCSLALMFFRVPIAISLAVPAFIGILHLRDWTVLTTAIHTIVWHQSTSYILTTIPMFVLMGELLTATGISSELFFSFRAWFGRVKGGLAMATIGASAIFAASSGSSLATTGTIGAISAKEMGKAGYSRVLIGGSIVAGGSLGILIPPSSGFILYGMMTEQSIGKLFIAGILPGILLSFLYILTIYVIVLLKPNFAPQGQEFTWKERFASLRGTLLVLSLFALVIGGMYLGWYSPTEAAAVGALYCLIVSFLKKKLTWQSLILALTRTLRTTGFLMAIILTAFILNYLLAYTRLPSAMAQFLTSTDLSKASLFTLIILMYVILGALMDTLAMIVVTVPVILPIISALGFDLIWFGVIIVVVIEIAQISPPMGISCFVLDGVAPELRLENIFKGGVVFLVPCISLIVILYHFPGIALFLVSTMR